jgi:hypothetical protein
MSTGRRTAPRLKILLTGRCIVGDQALNWTIVNISLSGTRPAFCYPVGPPDRFHRHIDGRDEAFGAALARRHGLEVGVGFDHAAAAIEALCSRAEELVEWQAPAALRLDVSLPGS